MTTLPGLNIPEINRELGRARRALETCTKKVNKLTDTLQDAERHQIEGIRAEIREAQQKESKLRTQIQINEDKLYGDWAPKDKPDPERQMEIGRAAGKVKESE